MAIERKVKLVADAEGAIKEVDKLKQGVKDTDKAAADSKKGFDKMKGGVSAMGLAFKALGIGLIVAAFVKLKDMLGQNQAIMDKVSVVTESLGFVFQKVVNVAVELGTKMTKAFSDPKQAVEDLWIALKQNIVNRIEGLIDTFGALGKVIKGVFKRDLDMIKEGASEAGTALVQLGTGFDEEQQKKMADGFKNLATDIKNTAKEATEYAKAITKMRNEVKLAEANQRQLQLQSQKQAEIQRQIRDDINLTLEERIEAGKKLKVILDKQFEDEKALVDQKIELAKAEESINKTNTDLQVARINTETDLVELEERITSQRSEQKTSLASLEKEYQDSLKITAKVAKKTGELEIKTAKLTSEQKLAIVANTMGTLASVFGEESKAGKALAIGQTLISTYTAAAAALKPPPDGAGPIWGIPIAAGAVISGLANVAKIKATKLPYGDSGGGGGGGSASVPSMPTGIGGAGLIPNLEGIEPSAISGETPAVQAYVVENDISNAQALQQELDVQATL